MEEKNCKIQSECENQKDNSEAKKEQVAQNECNKVQCECCCNGKDEFLEKLCNEYQPIKDNLIQMLNEVQEHYGYVPMRAQEALSEFLNVPMAEIYGVVTFYSRFTLKPKGKYNIAVCLGTACYVKGSQKIMDRLKDRLKIETGETTKDGKFSIEETRCVGACGLAPVFTVNGEVYGKATVQKLDQVLDELSNKD